MDLLLRLQDQQETLRFCINQQREIIDGCLKIRQVLVVDCKSAAGRSPLKLSQFEAELATATAREAAESAKLKDLERALAASEEETR